MSDRDFSVINRYWRAVRSAVAEDLGREAETGTAVVPAPARAGSPVVVVYPGPGFTFVWCSPHLATRLEPLSDNRALSVDEFVDACTGLGGTLYGRGIHRVLVERLDPPDHPQLAALDRDRPEHVALIEEFLAECPDDDIDEAEVELDELDPAITVTLNDQGGISAFASARPWTYDPEYDDIGVLVHPEHRRRGLGRTVVHALAHHQQSAGRIPLYNYDENNTGSHGVATAVGFDYLMTVAGVTFDD